MTRFLIAALCMLLGSACGSLSLGGTDISGTYQWRGAAAGKSWVDVVTVKRAGNSPDRYLVTLTRTLKINGTSRPDSQQFDCTYDPAAAILATADRKWFYQVDVQKGQLIQKNAVYNKVQ